MISMDYYKAIYKCQMCGGLFSTNKKYTKEHAETLINNICFLVPNHDVPCKVHCCKDNNTIGLGRLMGFQKILRYKE